MIDISKFNYLIKLFENIYQHREILKKQLVIYFLKILSISFYINLQIENKI